jgi:glycosyltransferase EpsD
MKILLTATVQSHICQFHRPLVEMLHEHGCEVHAAARNNLAEKNGLALDFVDRVIEVPFDRSPKSPKNLIAYRQMKALLGQEHYDIVLCNTPMGGFVTRLAARKARKNGTKVVYMAHGFHFYRGASKKSWLVYYPIEKWMARKCDILITINEEDFALAREKFHTNVAHVHGVGVSAERYHPADSASRQEMRAAEQLSSDDFVILCTGELNRNKDQKTLLSAAAQLKEKIPGLKVLLAGNGPLEAQLREQIAEEKLEAQVKLLGYRTDLQNLLPAVDLAVSCSHREGLGLNILEAMLCKVAVVAAANRGHNELVHNGINGFLVPQGDAAALAEKIDALYRDRDRMQAMGEAAFAAAQPYTASSIKLEMKDILGIDAVRS